MAQVKCEQCGKEFYKRPSHIKRNNHQLCSRECWDNWQRGKNNCQWKGGKVKLNCACCGKEFEVDPGRKNTSRFCSVECRGKMLSGKNNSKYIEPKKKNCLICNKEFFVKPSGINRTYCSKECADKAHSEKMKSKNNPNWLGGISNEPYAKEYTKEKKESIKKRDNYICRLCELKEHETKQKRLVTHHIDYDKNNTNDNNLITLCMPCHGKVHYGREEWKTLLSNLLKE